VQETKSRVQDQDQGPWSSHVCVAIAAQLRQDPGPWS